MSTSVSSFTIFTHTLLPSFFHLHQAPSRPSSSTRPAIPSAIPSTRTESSKAQQYHHHKKQPPDQVSPHHIYS
ncbi:uncharacterized protein BO66DRAFT_188173 [Aspergillus aculeatinus CBS 121060]|uniref:Uncharacterized protein n=1 Tax=Aspergillus aculeatinus CBS 121060 TaxID=1448322 RepID=A0ACD1GXU8_9EURO|nr:hypothetical protein BO66DRAFT_188173 [Aspergillus aculeatinus CBS 121060]RAH66302.1 hypothetical protein BO66DRAFT_188173 [Aspergillus aculeatinus CBS 121060]